jgi:arylsulfatase A-like enzyme
VPLIVRWPKGVKPGQVDNTSVLCAADFLPTVCKLAGAEVPKGHELDGEDRTATLSGKAARTKPLFWEWRFNVAGHVLNRCPMLAMRDGQWKLLMNPDGSRVELYDVPADASELNNLADRRPEVVKRMRERLLAWHKTLPKGPTDPEAGKNTYPWPKETP